MQELVGELKGERSVAVAAGVDWGYFATTTHTRKEIHCLQYAELLKINVKQFFLNSFLNFIENL